MSEESGSSVQQEWVEEGCYKIKTLTEEVSNQSQCDHATVCLQTLCALPIPPLHLSPSSLCVPAAVISRSLD